VRERRLVCQCEPHTVPLSSSLTLQPAVAALVVAFVQLADPSLLRFLVDMRGADPDDKQLRDDLMTMLIAGNEQLVCVGPGGQCGWCVGGEGGRKRGEVLNS
jgi:hypothetical protein